MHLSLQVPFDLQDPLFGMCDAMCLYDIVCIFLICMYTCTKYAFASPLRQPYQQDDCDLFVNCNLFEGKICAGGATATMIIHAIFPAPGAAIQLHSAVARALTLKVTTLQPWKNTQKESTHVTTGGQENLMGRFLMILEFPGERSLPCCGCGRLSHRFCFWRLKMVDLGGEQAFGVPLGCGLRLHEDHPDVAPNLCFLMAVDKAILDRLCGRPGAVLQAFHFEDAIPSSRSGQAMKEWWLRVQPSEAPLLELGVRGAPSYTLGLNPLNRLWPFQRV
eukprot:s702_g10.t1